MNPAHEQNRKSWNAVTPAHNRHKGDQAAFFRAGGSTLRPTETALLGGLAGLDVAHLQCNCGQDTLSLVQAGARVTGVDISDAAIAFARDLSRDSGVPATFVRSDLFDWLETAPERFDLCFASYGAIAWLSNLHTYFRGIARILRPGGRCVLVEFHPTCFIFKEDWSHHYPYSTGGVPIIEAQGVGDYVGISRAGLTLDGARVEPRPFTNPEPTHEFAWGIGDVLGAALAAGLGIDHFAEYPYSEGWKGFEPMTALPGRRWTVPDTVPSLPFMFSLGCRAP